MGLSKTQNQLLRFCNNWFPFSLQGITKSLIDAQFGNESLNGSHNKEISHALGYCIGFVIGTTCTSKMQCLHKLFELNFHSCISVFRRLLLWHVQPQLCNLEFLGPAWNCSHNNSICQHSFKGKMIVIKGFLFKIDSWDQRPSRALDLALWVASGTTPSVVCRSRRGSRTTMAN